MRTSPLAILVALLVVSGAAAIAWSYVIPAFSDESEMQRLMSTWPPDTATPEQRARFTRDWHAQMDGLRTPKWQVLEAGVILLTLGVLAAAAGLLLRRRPIRSWRGLSTPRHVATFIALSLVPPVLLCLGLIVDAVNLFYRYQLPPWGDSLAIVFFSVLGGLPFLVGICVVLAAVHAAAVRFPAPLLAPVRWTSPAIGIQVIYGLAALFWLGLAVLMAIEGDPLFMLAALVSAYLAASAGAGLARRFMV